MIYCLQMAIRLGIDPIEIMKDKIIKLIDLKSIITLLMTVAMAAPLTPRWGKPNLP